MCAFQIVQHTMSNITTTTMITTNISFAAYNQTYLEDIQKNSALLLR